MGRNILHVIEAREQQGTEGPLAHDRTATFSGRPHLTGHRPRRHVSAMTRKHFLSCKILYPLACRIFRDPGMRGPAVTSAPQVPGRGPGAGARPPATRPRQPVENRHGGSPGPPAATHATGEATGREGRPGAEHVTGEHGRIWQALRAQRAGGAGKIRRHDGTLLPATASRQFP